jgi:hypothetical protein
VVDLHRWEDDGGRVVPHEHMEGGDIVDDPRAKICLERHGFYLRPGPGDRFWVFVPVGQAPDGSPLTRTRPCWPEESRAWREGRFNDIALGLKAEGHPVRVDGPPHPGVFGRLLTALRRLAGRWTT